MTALGLLPEEWKTVRLENAANIIMGQSPPSSTYNAEIIGLPFFQGKADFGDVYPTIRKWCSAPARIAEKNDVLLSVRAPIGDVNMATERCCIGRGLASIRANQNSAGQYLFYRLVFSKELLENKGTGTTFKEINKAAVTSFLLPLPPLPEQKAIARVLSTIQKAIEAQDKIIAAARELKKSLMRYLFTYGPVPVEEAEQVPPKETQIGPMPEHWEVKRLVDIATLQRGKDLPKQNQVLGQYPVIGSSGIMGYHNAYVCGGPAVVTGRSGSIGKLSYVEGKYWPHNTGLYVKDFHGNNPKFIYYLLHLLDFRKYATGVSVPTLNRNFIHSALLPLPPVAEQQEIARILSSVDSKIEAEEKRKASLQALFKTMLHQLMTGKVRAKNLEAMAA